MKNQSEILQVLAPIYRDMGKDPRDLVEVRPSHGGWLNALRFEVIRADGATTWVSREALDRTDRAALTNSLLSFPEASGAATAELRS